MVEESTQTAATQNPPPSKRSWLGHGWWGESLEWLLVQIDTVKFWFTRAWRIGLVMGKGGYLLSQRKKLFTRLGQRSFSKIQKGDLSLNDLLPQAQQIQELERSIEKEELWIRRLRFGPSYWKKMKQGTT